MAEHRKVEPIKIIYQEAGEPVEPVKTPEMDAEEFRELHADWVKEHREWERLQKEAEEMKQKATGPEVGPGPNGPVVDAEHPVWENPLFHGTNGPGVQ